MKTYKLSAQVTISIHTRVRARSKAEALEIAAARGMSSGLVDQGHVDEEWITGEELDGAPTDIAVEK